MFGLSDSINWLIILRLELPLSQKATSTLIRNVQVGSYDVKDSNTQGTMRDFLFELDGFGTRTFCGELRFNITDEEVSNWIENYSREHMYEKTSNGVRFIGYGGYYDTACFSGKTTKIKLLPRANLIKTMLENVDYEDKRSRISFHRIYPKGSPFAAQAAK